MIKNELKKNVDVIKKLSQINKIKHEDRKNERPLTKQMKQVK